MSTAYLHVLDHNASLLSLPDTCIGMYYLSCTWSKYISYYHKLFKTFIFHTFLSQERTCYRCSELQSGPGDFANGRVTFVRESGDGRWNTVSSPYLLIFFIHNSANSVISVGFFVWNFSIWLNTLCCLMFSQSWPIVVDKPVEGHSVYTFLIQPASLVHSHSIYLPGCFISNQHCLTTGFNYAFWA
jgi:hypothetical protein